jgi:hypothetical protein
MTDLNSFAEYSEEELDEIAVRIGSKRPRRWGVVGSYQAVKQMMSKFPDDFEGFIVRQTDDGKRAKVKSLDYLKRHNLIGNSLFRNIVPLWVKGESSEILTYFPECGEKFETLENKFNKKVSDALITVQNLLGNNYSNKRDLAFAIKSQNLASFEASMVFNCFDKPSNQHQHLIEEQKSLA